MYPWFSRRSSFRHEMDRLRREMDDLVSLFTPRRPWSGPLWREMQLFPLLNVAEKADSFVVTAEIPGMKTDDLEIKFEGDTLTLKGERKPEEAGEDVSYHRRERAVGAFQRSLTLPAKVDSERVSAIYRNGVLTITLEKEKSAVPKQITVKPE